MASPYELQQDFRTEVLDVSMTTPVVIDFWAEWCGPCKIIGPILEKLAASAAGRWKLVKVDTEAWPDLAQIFRLQAIPTVVMIDQGQPVGQFQGALPEDQIVAWLEENLPEQPLSAMNLVEEAIAQGNHEQARGLLVRLLAQEPENAKAKELMVRVLFRFDPDAAATLALELPAETADSLRENLALLRDLIRWGRGEMQREIPDAPQADLDRYREAAVSLGNGDPAGAVDAWLEVLGRNRKLDEDGARRAAIALFDLLGPDDPISRDGRRRLSVLLF